MDIKVEWTGKYPSLCSGRWIITANDKKLIIPAPFVSSNMNTEKFYNTWSFGIDYSEEWDTYDSGINFDVWITENRQWIFHSFKAAGLLGDVTYDDLRELYKQINKLDWRHNSCGGCI